MSQLVTLRPAVRRHFSGHGEAHRERHQRPDDHLASIEARVLWNNARYMPKKRSICGRGKLQIEESWLTGIVRKRLRRAAKEQKVRYKPHPYLEDHETAWHIAVIVNIVRADNCARLRFRLKHASGESRLIRLEKLSR
ncbi:hypothetical protein FGB62_251g03 [Gracilaria domingensis]|nr:hypothetical protein FGB62_251g03 [Gracilaria domingensis]